MNLNLGEFSQIFLNIFVSNLFGRLKRLSFYFFANHIRGGYGVPTAQSFKLGVFYNFLSLFLFNLDINFHYVSAPHIFGVSDAVGVFYLAEVLWVHKVLNDLFGIILFHRFVYPEIFLNFLITFGRALKSASISPSLVYFPNVTLKELWASSSLRPNPKIT